MRRVWFTYSLGVLAASLAGFLSPMFYLGFIPVAAGLIWAAYDLIDVPEVTDGESSPASQRSATF